VGCQGGLRKLARCVGKGALVFGEFKVHGVVSWSIVVVLGGGQPSG
jgi:hypothetical protein